MKHLDDDLLMAYVDGELSPEEHARVEAALAHDPHAQQFVRLFKESHRLTAGIFDAPLRQPVPDRLLATITDTVITPAPTTQPAQVVSLADRRRTATPRSTWVPSAIAAGLALVVGLGIGNQMTPGENVTNTQLTNADFDQALEQAISGTTVALGKVALTPMMSFQDEASRFCREFSSTSVSAEQMGIACRIDGNWQLETLMSLDMLTPAMSNSNDYAPASGEAAISPYELILDRLMTSAPLAPQEEATLIEQGWSAAR